MMQAGKKEEALTGCEGKEADKAGLFAAQAVATPGSVSSWVCVHYAPTTRRLICEAGKTLTRVM